MAQAQRGRVVARGTGDTVWAPPDDWLCAPHEAVAAVESHPAQAERADLLAQLTGLVCHAAPVETLAQWADALVRAAQAACVGPSRGGWRGRARAACVGCVSESGCQRVRRAPAPPGMSAMMSSALAEGPGRPR